jgi:uncharacterized membrane protein
MLAVTPYMLVFRIIHIVLGVTWVGGLALVVLFIQPSARSLGPAGDAFVRELLVKRRLGDFLLAAGGATIAAGLFLYWHDLHAAGSLGDWLSLRFGLALTIGATAALTGWLVALLVVRPTLNRVFSLAASLAAGDQPPPPERVAEMQILQLRVRRLTITVFGFLLVTVLAMATARYW